MARNIVILGSGHGGVQAAASLREDGFDGTIRIVSADTDLPYHKPPLSKTFIKDQAAQPQPLRGEIFYQNQDIDLELGVTVESIDARSRRLTLGNGAALDFDSLILATGSRPRLLPQAQHLTGVYALRTLADARLIREAAASAQEVVVIGAGFIGLEIAATLSAGRTVTVIEAAPRVLGRGVARQVADHVATRLTESGVRIITGARIDGIESDDGRVSGIRLVGNERIPAQLVIVGIGVEPNVELAETAGLICANGISVDDAMKTSADNILAIGDCVSFRHWMTGAKVRLESVQNATDQARLASRTIVGQPASYDAVPWFWSDIGDMKLQMVGLIGRQDNQVVVGSPEENRFSVYHFEGERLIAIESVNKPADHMLGRKMLAAGYSPARSALAADPAGLKAAFADWQQLQINSGAPDAP